RAWNDASSSAKMKLITDLVRSLKTKKIEIDLDKLECAEVSASRNWHEGIFDPRSSDRYEQYRALHIYIVEEEARQGQHVYTAKIGTDFMSREEWNGQADV